MQSSIGRAPRLAIITGSDDVREIVKDPRQPTNCHGVNDSVEVLKLLEPPVDLQRMHITPNYFRQPTRWRFSGRNLIWNAITDVDQNPRTLEVAQRLVSPLGMAVVNQPARIPRTRRHILPGYLAGIDGVLAPKVLLLKNPTLERVQRQAREAEFRFPAILREAGSHGGDVLGIVQGPDEMNAIYGDRVKTYYLTEFVDVRARDGFYRKTRLFFVGEAIITRQHIISDEWSIHGRSSRGLMGEREDLLSESRARLIEGFETLPDATRRAVAEIRDRVGLDYCGLDCCVMEDGQVVTFECNATMNFNVHFRNPKTQHNRAALPRMLSALQKLLDDKIGVTQP